MGAESVDVSPPSYAAVDGRSVGVDPAEFSMDDYNEGEGALLPADALCQGPLKKPKLSAGETECPVSSPSGSTQSETHDDLVFTWTIPDFSKISVDKLYSPTFSSGPGEAVWRLLLFPYGNNAAADSHLSVYVELESPPSNPGWRCSYVQFQFQLLNQIHPEKSHFSDECTFEFNRKGLDRGYDAFFPLQKLGIASEFQADDKIELRTVIKFLKLEPVETPNLAHCRLLTGHVGLKNQGATCYMNSLLQTLFHIGYFRRAVYQLPLDEGSKPSIALALQKLFAGLQTSEDSVCTKDLTASFGWQSIDSFMQHDVQEFSRVLCDNLETKMKNTPVEGVIAKLFEGKSEAFIDCINVDYKSTRIESFYDLSLNVKGLRNLYESFDQYVETETLEGPNQYRADTFGLQDALKGVRFVSFPPVLFIQLKRFEYDPVHNSMVKLNDRFDFPVHLDLNKYVECSDNDYSYVLYSVLVHSGSVYGGHYYACISPNPSKSPDVTSAWFKFDDDFVSAIPQTSAVNEHYGEDYPSEIRQFSRRGRELRPRTANAYMLVYIRRNQLDETLGEMKESDIPSCIRERIVSDELAAADLEAAALAEANKVTVSFFTSQHLMSHNGIELRFTPSYIKIDYDKLCPDLVQEIASVTHIPADSQLWYVYSKRENRTIRTNKVFDWRASIHKSISQMFDLRHGWGNDGFAFTHDLYIHHFQHKSFVEADSGMMDLTLVPSRLNESDILLFFKWFDPSSQTLSYVGSSIVSNVISVHQLGREILRIASLPLDKRIDMYEEEDVKADRISFLSPELTLVDCKLVDGDIIVCQDQPVVDQQPPLSYEQTKEGSLQSQDSELFYCPDVPSYLQMLYHRCIVTCIPVLAESEPSPSENRLVMRNDWTIPQVISCVGSVLRQTDHDRMVIYSKAYNEMSPNRNQRYSVLDNEITLDHLIKFCDDPSNPIFFEMLDYSVHDLVSHSVVNVHFFDSAQNVKIFNVLIPKGNDLADSLFQAIRGNPNVTLNRPDKLRLLVVNSGRALLQLTESSRIESLFNCGSRQSVYVRADEPPDVHHSDRHDGQVNVWVSRFMSGFVPKFYGEPVPVVISKGQTLLQCREKLCSEIGGKNEEFKHTDQWIFARMPVKGSAGMVPISDDQVVIPNDEFLSDDYYFICVDQGRDGARRSARINPLDRPVRIYN